METWHKIALAFIAVLAAILMLPTSQPILSTGDGETVVLVSITADRATVNATGSDATMTASGDALIAISEGLATSTHRYILKIPTGNVNATCALGMFTTSLSVSNPICYPITEETTWTDGEGTSMVNYSATTTASNVDTTLARNYILSFDTPWGEDGTMQVTIDGLVFE